MHCKSILLQFLGVKKGCKSCNYLIYTLCCGETGKYTSAEIFTENIEDAALQWVKEQCDHPAFESVRIVQMPDVHAGNSCNVGTAYRIRLPYLNPDHVGVDIGCTISMHRLSSVVAPEDLPLLDHKIRGTIPAGMEICEKNSLNEKELFRFLNSQYQRARSSAPDLINEVPRIDARFVSDFCRRIKLQEAIFYKSLGTLGGGNHFIEYGEDDKTQKDGSRYIAVHGTWGVKWPIIGTTSHRIRRERNS